MANLNLYTLIEVKRAYYMDHRGAAAFEKWLEAKIQECKQFLLHHEEREA